MRKLTIKDLEKNISKYKYKKISLEELSTLEQYSKNKDVYYKYFNEFSLAAITCYKITNDYFYAAYIMDEEEINGIYSHYHWWGHDSWKTEIIIISSKDGRNIYDWWASIPFIGVLDEIGILNFKRYYRLKIQDLEQELNNYLIKKIDKNHLQEIGEFICGNENNFKNHNYTACGLTEGSIFNEEFYAVYVLDDSKIGKLKKDFPDCTFNNTVIFIASIDGSNVTQYYFESSGKLEDGNLLLILLSKINLYHFNRKL